MKVGGVHALPGGKLALVKPDDEPSAYLLDVTAPTVSALKILGDDVSVKSIYAAKGGVWIETNKISDDNSRAKPPCGTSTHPGVRWRVGFGAKQAGADLIVGASENVDREGDDSLFGRTGRRGAITRAVITAHFVQRKNAAKRVTVPMTPGTFSGNMFPAAADQALYRAKRNGRNRVEAERRRLQRQSAALMVPPASREVTKLLQ